MAIRLNKTGEHVQYGTAIYTADTENDLQSLPNGNTPGSTCFCIATSKTYILNNQHEWVEKKAAGGGSESSGSSYPSADSRSFPLYNDDVTLTTQSQYYNDIVKAINEKAGTDLKYTPAQMATAIENIPSGRINYLIDYNDLIANYYIDSATGNLISYSGWSTSDYIEVTEGESLAIASSSNDYYNAWYDSSKTFISNFTTPTPGYDHLTVPNGAGYVRISNSTGAMQKMQLWRES